jgi:flagellin-like hook-associated protein FlgL
MTDVSLNSGIRANLLQLQRSSASFQTTTERLASGKKVNSAIDNPSNFFAAVNLSDRAEALNSRLDGIGQAVQTVKAADNGISTIRSFVSAMKGVVNNALGNADGNERADMGRQFNELLVQVAQTAKDSSYQGVNLLQGSETNTVQFGESFDASKLDVLGFDLGGPGSEVNADGEIAAAAQTAAIQVASTASAVSVSASGYSAFSEIAAASQTVSYAGAGGFLTQTDAADAAGGVGTAAVASAAGGTASAAVALYMANQTGDTAIGIQGAGSVAGSIEWSGANYKDELAAVVQQLEAFDSELKTQASSLSQNLASITIREEFSNNLINTLNEGADKMTLADLNEEGANLLALQTSTQLATQSLSLASQQSQGVLQLLG